MAVKIMKKKIGHSQLMEQLDREITVLKAVNHPHIVCLEGIYETPEKIYFIME